jgi:tetratricopeptide (TPR) repeat protein
MPEAVTHLRRSLELDPYQPRARTVLELLLLTLARLPEARLELSAHEALFPEDGNATVLRAMVLALQGDLPTANAVLDRLRGRAADADLAGYRQLLGLLAELPRPENAPDPDRGAPELVRHLLAAAPGLVRLWHAERGEDKPGGLFGATQSFFHNLPLPFLVRRMAPHLRRAVENLPNGLPNEVALREMAWVARVHPEGTILYYRALMLLGTFQWAAAEKAALEAAHAPALLHVRPHALNIAITAEGMRYAMSRDPNVLRVALANLRELRTLGPYRFPKPQIPVGLAMRAGDWNLARELLDEWRLREPGNGERPWWRAHVEFYAGNPVAALAAVDRALKTKPRDVALLNIRNAAAAQLREQVGRLFLRSPDNFFRACGTTWVGLLGSPAGSLLVVATLPVKIPAKN